MRIQNVALLAFIGSFFLLIVFIALASYVLAAIGLYTMAKNRGIENAWIAWIPVVQLYILGRLIGTLPISSYEVPQPELVLPGLAVAGSVLSNVRLIGGLIGLASLVINLFALHKLYRIYRPDQATLYLVLSILLPFMGPVFLFIMRNDEPVVAD
ncbi:MAG: hypothetical protein SCK57_08350 [Bacillota bacterium]|nr:hypothetical protein [Bacillota bacterium]MDW7677658.1 hypothetical protein [Bacillota bacterium]